MFEAQDCVSKCTVHELKWLGTMIRKIYENLAHFKTSAVMSQDNAVGLDTVNIFKLDQLAFLSLQSC